MRLRFVKFSKCVSKISSKFQALLWVILTQKSCQSSWEEFSSAAVDWAAILVCVRVEDTTVTMSCSPCWSHHGHWVWWRSSLCETEPWRLEVAWSTGNGSRRLDDWPCGSSQTGRRRGRGSGRNVRRTDSGRRFERRRKRRSEERGRTPPTSRWCGEATSRGRRRWPPSGPSELSAVTERTFYCYSVRHQSNSIKAGCCVHWPAGLYST